MKRKLSRSVYLRGKRYGNKDVDALAALLTADQIEDLRQRRILLGDDWEPVTDGPLAEGFPKKRTLVKAGLDSIAKVKAASDEDLKGLGLSELSIAKIRNLLG